jgi:dTDP-4-dehydro-6-deoxy-alpha-D-glucopyranose 2,3-dehydratase
MKKNLEYFNRLEIFRNSLSDLSSYEIEKLVEHSMCTNVLNTYDEVVAWAEKIKKRFNTEIKEIPLGDLQNWNVDSNKIAHSSGKFFEVLGFRIGSNSLREVEAGWDQPIIKEHGFDGGVLCLLRTYIEELPHYLIQARFEPGNYNHIQLSPTLQATFSNLNQEHGGKKPPYSEFFEDYSKNQNEYIFNEWLAEDGGKFYFKRNKGLVKHVDYENTYLLDDSFMWLSLFQIKKLLEKNSLVNPHLSRLIFL